MWSPLRRPAAALLAALTLLAPACSEAADPDDLPEALRRDTAEVDRTGALLSGATWRVAAPEDWNGTLLLYSHGTTWPGRPNPARLAADQVVADALLDRGFALAGSSYADAGWVVETAIADQLAVLDVVEAELGPPDRILAWGSSQGGLITVGLVERHPERFDGAVAACGAVAGSDALWDTLLDVGYVLRVLVAPAVAVADLPDDGSGSLAALGSAAQLAQQTPAGRARLALAAAVGGVPGWTGVGTPRPHPTAYAAQQEAQAANLGALTPLLTTLRAHLEDTFGGNPSTNVGVDYGAVLQSSPHLPQVASLYAAAGLDLTADLGLLAAVPRVAADQSARTALIEAIRPTGALEDPLLTIHTSGDAVVPVGHTRAYAELAEEAGAGDLVRQATVERAGHCSFTAAEQVAAIETVLARAETGEWPETGADALTERAEAAGEDLAVVPDSSGRTPGLPQRPAFTDAPQPALPRVQAVS